MQDETCNLSWVVNASGAIGVSRKIGVLFQSNNTGVIQNTTRNATVNIVGCTTDFTLNWNSIDFGLLNPSSAGNAAPGNNAGYNITTNPGSCDLDFYIKGTNLTNSTLNYIIEVGNLSWSNSTNDYASSFRLASINTAIKMDVADTNVTTRYWLDIPPVLASLYNGSISITGVRHGNSP